MSFRHLAREIVVQALFAWDMRGQEPDQQQEHFDFSIDRFSGKIPDQDFPSSLYNGVIKKIDVIDDIIGKAAPQWPLNRIAPVDRNILRLGIYELLFSGNGDVPPRVAINESIELAKTFGSKNSYKFVSGVLGSIFEASPRKAQDDEEKQKPKKETPAIVEKKVGAFIYTFGPDGAPQALFVNNVFGYWTLPKGGSDDIEQDPKEVLKTVINTKCGIDIEVGDEISHNSYTSNDPEKGKVTKEITYYHAYCPSPDVLDAADVDGITEAKWFHVGDIKGLKTYPDMKKILDKGAELTKAADIV